MKTSLMVACLALLPLTAQENSELKHLTVGTRANGRPPVPGLHLAAKDLEQNAGVVYLRGSVEIDLPTHILLADEAEYDEDSGEIQAHGNVHLKPARQDTRAAGQFGIK